MTQHLTEARAHHLRGFATLAGEACRAEDGTTFPEHGWAVQGRRAQTVVAAPEGMPKKVQAWTLRFQCLHCEARGVFTTMHLDEIWMLGLEVPAPDDGGCT